MKAVNDYRILMPNVPYYETGILFNQYEIVYYTGINSGIYTDNTKTPPITQTVDNPVAGRTGYYYLKNQAYNVSGDNKFWTRPDSELNDVDATAGFYDWWVQNFFFNPTYGSTVDFTANYYENTFQDNYRYILGKSENVIQVKATLNFDGITDNEARAINHFYQNYFTKNPLSYGQGHQPVEMSLFFPHNKIRPFYLTNIDNNFENIDFNKVVLEVESPFISLTSWKEKLIPFEVKFNYFDTATYTQHDIVYARRINNTSDGFFYYSGTGTSKNVSPYSSDPNQINDWTQKFYFSPDIVQNISFKNSDYKNDLGNFYLYQQEGINPNFFDFELNFNNRSDKEAKAILHFLENHNGLDFFEYDMFPPFTGTRAFFCPQWSHTYNFADNHTIRAKFVESKFNFAQDSIFDTFLYSSGIDFEFVPLGFTKSINAKIKNNESKPIEFTISADNNITLPSNVVPQNAKFVAQADNQAKNITAKAGGDAVYTLVCNMNYDQNEDKFTPKVFDYTGIYYFTQENEILGKIANNNLELEYSGNFFDAGQTINKKFLSGVKTCVAAPYYDFAKNKLGFQASLTLPDSGFYFTRFSGRISQTSGAFVANEFTGVSTNVTLNNTTSLYDIGSPGVTKYLLNFEDVSLGVDYYIRVSGGNADYLGENSGVFVYASGIDRIDQPISNNQVISGLTVANLQTFSINPPSIRVDGRVEEFNINETKPFFNLYQFLEENARFKTAFSLYSGVKINFNNCQYGPLNSSDYYTEHNTGVFIITGNYSVMPSGVELNFKNSSLISKGGKVYKTKNTSDPIYSGKNVLYINCSGTININKDFETIFGAGGGAGDNISFSDVSNYDAANQKYTTFALSVPSNVNNNKIINKFNSADIKTNSTTTTTHGSSLLYDFFDPTKSDPYQVFGGAGAGFGQGTGIGDNIFVNDASKTLSSKPYSLFCVLELNKDRYGETGGN